MKLFVYHSQKIIQCMQIGLVVVHMFQMFHQDMHDGLPDHLPLLVSQELARGGVRFIDMRCIFGENDPARVQLLAEEICANNRFDETVVNAKFLRQIKPPRDAGPDAIKLAGHSPLHGAVHFRSGQRNAIAPRFKRFERHVLDGLVTGDAGSGSCQQRPIHVEQSLAAIEQNVRVHDKQKLGFRTRQTMHEGVPGVIAAGLANIPRAASKGVGEGMCFLLLRENRGGDVGRAIRAAVGNAKHFATLSARAEFFEQRLFEKRFQGAANDRFLVPGPDGDGDPRRLGLSVSCHSIVEPICHGSVGLRPFIPK